jgi:cephalosporin-C deacetylase-like acetyl esterase
MATQTAKKRKGANLSVFDFHGFGAKDREWRKQFELSREQIAQLSPKKEKQQVISTGQSILTEINPNAYHLHSVLTKQAVKADEERVKTVPVSVPRPSTPAKQEKVVRRGQPKR